MTIHTIDTWLAELRQELEQVGFHLQVAHIERHDESYFLADLIVSNKHHPDRFKWELSTIFDTRAYKDVLIEHWQDTMAQP